MFFFKGKEKTKFPTKTSIDAFTKEFERRLGQSPVDYISKKMENGSDISAIRNVFDIMAAEIELRSKCKCPGFDFYYEKALSHKILSPSNKNVESQKITRGFAASQLIGKERFLKQYKMQLQALSQNTEFMEHIYELRRRLSGGEMSNTTAVNRYIANYFHENNIKEKFPEVKMIVDAVLAYGKQASVFISTYYAMFLYE